MNIIDRKKAMNIIDWKKKKEKEITLGFRE